MLVSTGQEDFPIDSEIFSLLFENSVVHYRRDYTKALEKGSISLRTLVDLSRDADIPYPLFFAPKEVVAEQLSLKTRKLLQGVSRDQFSMNARGTVALSDIELIVKDLLRKQELFKRHNPRAKKNKLVGLISKVADPAVGAAALLDHLSLDMGDLRSLRTKEAAVKYYIEHLEDAQVLVARSVRGFMPQPLDRVRFSGVTIRDSKVPYIFLAGGSHGEDEEPWGRQLFTLALFTVMIGRKIFSPVTMDATSLLQVSPPEYSIAAEMLMPSDLVSDLDMSSMDLIRSAADSLKVTPSALVVRANHLREIEDDTAEEFLKALSSEFRQRPKPRARAPKPIKAVRKYNGDRFTRAMLAAMDAGYMSQGDFCRIVGGRKITPAHLPELRELMNR
ncbi:ImmA/IrrE family metallo-endopeptidase [Micrococcus lylae]|uniref:ImmA/IrrE family metallo-endopeptidase n=1 Tax=Micrococcus lylae TaxID=1273 RepID=UPI003EC036B2